MSTIAAISTPAAAGGIAVIRVSGERSLEIAEKLFLPFGPKRLSDMPGHSCAYGRIVSGGETLDDVLLTVFRAPKSYTGEDIVEISCHGGIYVTRRILREVIAAGAEPAEAGEFTKRAFLNGKLSLTQAEAVADIISAEGESALQSANMMREGALFKEIKKVSERLISLLGGLSAWTDYPDEDLPETEPKEIESALEAASGELEKIIRDYDSGLDFRDGISCAIVGRPNVGKSTLMNALLGYERSIVTDAAGTTRDVVEEQLRLGDVLLRISDTAGLRDADDEAERLGVRLAERAFLNAQLVFAVFDGSAPLSEGDLKLLESLKGRRHIVIVNKADLPQKIDLEYFKDENILKVSAKSSLGLEKIRERVYEMFGLSGYAQNPAVFANERQKLCCDRALERVRQALSALKEGETLDAVTVLVDGAAEALLELTGERVTDAVVNDVFSRFCVGK